MNKEDLVKEVSKKLKVPQKIVADVIVASIESIEKTVSKGKKVTLVGFGTFESCNRAARLGRNPQTGEAVPIDARTLPVFRPGTRFKEVVSRAKRGRKKANKYASYATQNKEA